MVWSVGGIAYPENKVGMGTDIAGLEWGRGWDLRG